MSHRPRHALKTFSLSLLAAATLAACTSDEDATPSPPTPAPEPTPSSLRLERIGGYATNLFGKSAAEIPAYDPASKRAFVVNADAGAVDEVFRRLAQAPPLQAGGRGLKLVVCHGCDSIYAQLLILSPHRRSRHGVCPEPARASALLCEAVMVAVEHRRHRRHFFGEQAQVQLRAAALDHAL